MIIYVSDVKTINLLSIYNYVGTLLLDLTKKGFKKTKEHTERFGKNILRKCILKKISHFENNIFFRKENTECKIFCIYCTYKIYRVTQHLCAPPKKH